MTRSFSIVYDDSVLRQAGLTRDEFERQAKLLMAAKLFERRLLSSDEGAGLCGMERVAFLLALPEVCGSISNLDPDDADNEVAFAIRA